MGQADAVINSLSELLLEESLDPGTVGPAGNRSGEVWATRVVGPLGWIIPKAVRPIPARAVASALLAAILDAKPGIRVLKSGAMQAHDQP